MPLPERPLRLVVVLALVFLAAAVVPSASATTAPPFAVGYDALVYGDFLYAGNGVLRCPVAADHAPTSGPVATPAACANTADRKDTLPNDDFFLQWADIDADPGTFDSASASVSIPPGAKIAFARLNWAGSTTCKSAVSPPGTPAKQNVRLSVGSAKPVDLAPSGYAEDAGHYSAHADVTDRFASAPTGTALDLTVGNVWAAKGFDCVGGWSMALVYAYPERNADYAPNKRKVVVYDGHVQQTAGAPATETTITGFRAAAADAHLGVTAYDGDWGASGDQFLVDGTPAAEPATGGTSNFFVSNADNAAAPAAKNNFSVDAKAFNVDRIPAGATSAKLGFVTSGDAYLAQNLAFSVPVPELQLALRATQPKVHAGEPVTFAVAVTNPGSVPATGVQVADEAVPACAKPLGTLAPGQTVSYACTGTAPPDDFTNAAKATGTSALGDALDGVAAAPVDVLHPALGLTKTADRPAYRAGDTATFTVKAVNTGDTGLSGLQVTDPKTPSCAQPPPGAPLLGTLVPGSLAPGESRTWQCTAKAPIADGVTTATATATDELGKPVTATADAPAPTIAPAVELTKTANPPVVHAGDPVTWTVTAHNTGDSPLAPVTVTDDTTTSCSRTLAGLPAGATQTYTCTANPSRTTTSHATATGTDLSGQPVTATASATVTVITPALTLTKDATPAVARAGDPVTFSITVANAGDAPLTDVAVTDDRTPACAKAIGALPPQGEQTYTCTAPAPADDFTNTATATGKDQLGGTVKVTDDAVVDVIHPAVTLTARAAPAQVREGGTVTWTITATNTGDVPLTGVAVADDQVAACAKPLGTLQPKATQTYACTTVAGTAGFTNKPVVTGTDPTARPVTATAEAAFTVQHPAVAITADVTGGPFREGDTVPFRITVRNTGDVPLTGLHVTDAQAARTTGCTQAIDGALEPGATREFGCTAPAPADDVTRTVRVSATPPAGPDVTAAAVAAVDVIHPAVAITRSAEPTLVRHGDTVTSTITVTNTGDSPLREVSVADQLAPDCTKSWERLEPQAKQTYSCTEIAGDADFAATAKVTATDATNRPVTATAGVPVEVIHPAVTITNDAAPAQVRQGDTVTFTLVVANTGDVPLADVSVVDSRTPACAHSIGTLLPGATQRHSCKVAAGTDNFVSSATATGTDPTNRQVSATDDAAYTVLHPGLALTQDIHGGPFRAGDPVPSTITVTNTGDGPLTAVKVDASCAKTFDKLEAGAAQKFDCTTTAPADDVVTTAKATANAPVGPPVTAADSDEVDVIHPALKLTKDAKPEKVRAGDEVTFTVVVRNTGDVALTGVSVVDDQPCAREFDGLPAGATQTYTCTRKAPADDFTAPANVTGTDPTGRSVQSRAEAEVDVVHPEIAVMKDATPYEVREGDTVTFSVLVKNTGDVPLTAVTVVDDHTPSCAHTAPELAVDAEITYTCTVVAGKQGFTGKATATGQDPTGRPVSAFGDATFVVRGG
ncbi:hypothetical protein MUY14_37655 [Amycolatopsis sp. FBCC-B4732]|uniref:DUF7507 domain-containing protein n=1 Tax=Amycolatopsis sp. FBCC-B4732 TaxID=3079339 RepID=UPI001FF531A4|nr:hypothetical protein [Amycolatopsis sp. FBCC-B4732]UOX87401.1 hypothetical protein MUY14_37655 [Amycolatopsis sp. FBCC-B4732]